jgi:dienelactone hydrolase
MTAGTIGPGPDGWGVGVHATPLGWPAPTQRLRDQRWALDATIGQVGPDWDQGRTRYIGAAGAGAAEADFFRARTTIAKLADFDRVFGGEAERRERRSREAEAAGLGVSARDHAFIAALLWGAAEWTFFLGPDEARRAKENGLRKSACYDRWMALAPHPVRRLRIPYGSATLSAILHLPEGPAPAGGFPAVLHVGGVDSFKEHAVAMYGDRYLQRGIARLVFDGPGQGEAIFDGAWVSRTNMVDAGLAALELLSAQPEIDAGRIGLSGVSFGSWWATQIAAQAPDIVGTAVWAVCHEDGLGSLFGTASPTFKARFMAMAGFVEEDAFESFVSRWQLSDDAAAISTPYLAIAGEDDELSPIRHTYRLLSRMPAPRRLMIYRGERHSIGGGPASRLGPDPLLAAADWFVERFEGRPIEEDVTVVETTGRTATRPLDDWLQAAASD